MDNSMIEGFKLEEQLSFPLYVCSKEIVRRYKPHLDKLDLTYTQYITMMILWEQQELNVKELGKRLFLDSGTLTPVLKKLESKGYVNRTRSLKDERNLIVTITEKGQDLKSKAIDFPVKIEQNLNLTAEESKELYRLLYKILDVM